MTDLNELVKQTQKSPTKKTWYSVIEDQECGDYLAWVACDHMAGKKANAAAMARVLYNHFKIKVSVSSIKGWLQKVEIGEVVYEEPEKTG